MLIDRLPFFFREREKKNRLDRSMRLSVNLVSGWLHDWWLGWAGRVIIWLDKWSVGQVIGWVNGWLHDWLIGWLAGPTNRSDHLGGWWTR